MSMQSFSLLMGLFIIGFQAAGVGCSNQSLETSHLDADETQNTQLIITCNGRTLSIPLSESTPVQSKAIKIEKPADLTLGQDCGVSMIQSPVDATIQWLANPGELLRFKPGATKISSNNGILSISGDFYLTHKIASALPTDMVQTAAQYLSLEQGRSSLIALGADPATETSVPNHPSCPDQAGAISRPTGDPGRNKIWTCMLNNGQPSALLYTCKAGTQATPNQGGCQAPVVAQPAAATQPAGTVPSSPIATTTCGTGVTCTNGWGWIPAGGNTCKAGIPGWIPEKNGCSCKC